MNNERELLRIDLGCGSIKKEGTLGLDILAAPGVDYVLNIGKQPLPFEDRSVEYVYSSHFLEHTPNFGDVFVEISRVCANGAQLELWTPYGWSNSAFVLDHKFFFTEEVYHHICLWYVDFWVDALKARWILNEFRYVVPPETLAYLKANRISLDFALKHLHNIAREFGTYITVLHDDLTASSPPFKRTVATDRFAPSRDVSEFDLEIGSGAPWGRQGFPPTQ